MAGQEKYEYSEKVRIPVFRGMFVRLFEKDNNGRFGLTAVWEDGQLPEPVKKAIKEATEKLWGAKAADRRKHPKFKGCTSRGSQQCNDEGERYTGFNDKDACLKMSTKQKPGVVDRRRRAIISADGLTITDKESDTAEDVEANEIYSGAYYMATGSAQAYQRPDGFGCSFKLDNVQKVRNGERIGGGRNKAEDDFDPLDDEDDFEDDMDADDSEDDEFDDFE